MNNLNMSSGDEYNIWTVFVICIILSPITCLGAVGNVINIKRFLRLGISDGVNMSLISLATSDLLYLISAFVISICLMLHLIEELSTYKVLFPVNPEAVFTFFTNVASGFYSISMLVTTFITVVRCLAVANPLRYRHLMSRTYTAILILIFVSISETSAVLLLVFMDIRPQYDSNINRTRPALWLSPRREIFKMVIFGSRDTFLPLASQIIVGICVIVMIRYLRRASKHRKDLYITIDNKGIRSVSRIGDPLNTVNTLQYGNESKKVYGKELQVVQQMLLIAVVYSLCNMPKVIFNLTQIIVTDFCRGGRYNDLYLTFNTLRELIQSVNASVTIFIYWKYNSKFRSHIFKRD